MIIRRSHFRGTYVRQLVHAAVCYREAAAIATTHRAPRAARMIRHAMALNARMAVAEVRRVEALYARPDSEIGELPAA